MLGVPAPKTTSTYHQAYYLSHLAQWKKYTKIHREKIIRLSKKDKLAYLEKRRVVRQAYTLTHLESLRKKRRIYRLAHQKQIRKAMHIYRRDHREYFRKDAVKRSIDRRITVFNHYGHHCVCCGETQPKFLAIDHIHGGGNKHIREIGLGNFYKWLIKNNYPKGFQVLCHNCNFAKGHYGSCPHSTGVKT